MFAEILSPSEQRARYAALRAKFAPKPEPRARREVPPAPPAPPVVVPVVIPPDLADALAAPVVPQAEEAPQDVNAPWSPPEITVRSVVAIVARETGLPVKDICGPHRARVLVDARQIVMWICRDMTSLSHPVIGKRLGGRDHTTVLHGAKRIAREIHVGTEIGRRALAMRELVRNAYGLEGGE